MELIEYNISASSIFRLIILSIFVFLLFRLINYVLNRIKSKNTPLKILAKNILLVELITWIFFLIWAANSFKHNNPILSIGITIVLTFIIFWLSYYGLKNMIAGVFFKYQENYTLGDQYQNEEYEGRIIEFTLFGLKIESKDGKTISIPYGNIANTVSTHPKTDTTKTAYSFELSTSKEIDVEDMIQEVKKSLLTMAWISTHHMPIIQQIQSTNSNFLFKVSLFAVSNEYALKTEQILKSKFKPKQ